MNVNNFGPFNSEVWGTVSEWTIVLVTILTAILLYKTLKSQISVQKNQQRITDIEGERFRIEYKPIFELNVKTIRNKILEREVESYVNVTLNVTKNDCKNFNITIQNSTAFVKSHSISKNSVGTTFPIIYIYNPDSFDLHFTIINSKGVFDGEGSFFRFFIEFDDVIGNSYRQEFTYIFQDKLEQTYINNPERVFK